MFVHAKLRVHKTVIVGVSLHRLIYDVLTDIVFPIFCHPLNLKNISQAYAQTYTYIAESDFTF